MNDKEILPEVSPENIRLGIADHWGGEFDGEKGLAMSIGEGDNWLTFVLTPDTLRFLLNYIMRKGLASRLLESGRDWRKQ